MDPGPFLCDCLCQCSRDRSGSAKISAQGRRMLLLMGDKPDVQYDVIVPLDL